MFLKFLFTLLFYFRTLSIDCDEAQQTIVAQMNEWESNPCPEPVDGKPNGQKCKYKVLIIFFSKIIEINLPYCYIRIVRHTN